MTNWGIPPRVTTLCYRIQLSCRVCRGLLRLAIGLPGRITSPPIIGATCAFDAKIYKNVDGFFSVSPCLVWDKKLFQISDFSFQLPALLVENRAISGIILPPHRRVDYLWALEAVCCPSEENLLFDKCNRQTYINLGLLFTQKGRFANWSCYIAGQYENRAA